MSVAHSTLDPEARLIADFDSADSLSQVMLERVNRVAKIVHCEELYFRK